MHRPHPSILIQTCRLALAACAVAAAAFADGPKPPREAKPPDVDAMTKHAAELRERGAYPEAIAASKQAVAAATDAHGDSDPRTIAAKRSLAAACLELEDHATAIPLLREVLSTLERSHPQDPVSTALVLGDLGQATYFAGQPREAEAMLRQSLEAAERASGPNHEVTALAANNLGAILRLMGRPREAEPLMRRALRIRERALGPDAPLTAQSLCTLGVISLDVEDMAIAESFLRHSLAVRRRVLPARHPDIAESAEELARLLMILGRYDEAHSLASEAFEITRSTFGAGHPLAFGSMHLKADASFALGRVGESDALHEELLRRIESLRPEQGDMLVRVLDDYARHMVASRKPAKAVALQRRAVALHARLHRDDDMTAIRLRRSLAESLYSEGKAADAVREGRAIVALLERQSGTGHEKDETVPNVNADYEKAAAIHSLAKFLLAHDGMEEARRLLPQSLSLFEKTLGRGSGPALQVIYMIAITHAATGDMAEAERLVQDAFDRFSAEPDIRSTSALTQLIGLHASILRNTGRTKEAERAEAALKKIESDQPR